MFVRDHSKYTSVAVGGERGRERVGGGGGAGSVMPKARPARLTDGLSRANNNNNSNNNNNNLLVPPVQLTVEMHGTEPEPVPSPCGCMTDLTHHQFHLHHHPPTPHYHGNIDVSALTDDDVIDEVTPPNDLLSIGKLSA